MAFTTIDDPEAYFQVTTWTGNGSTRSITLGGDTDMQPDLVWIKNRGGTYAPPVFDAVRGATKFVEAHDTTAENTEADSLTSFNSDGFSLGADSNSYVNRSSSPNTYVAWCWKESATAGFDIVSYTGDGSTRTISHSLSAVPDFVMIRCRSDARSWVVTNTAKGFTGRAFLDTTDAWGANSGEFNDTAPTSSVFTLGGDYRTNKSSETYVAYLWKNIQGFSKTGTYKGNGNDNGPYIHLGLRPAFFMVKRTDGADSWFMYDNKRSPSNVIDDYLIADGTGAETSTSAVNLDFTASGVKIRNDDGGHNNSSGTYIYMAFAEAPFVNSNGVPCNAR